MSKIRHFLLILFLCMFGASFLPQSVFAIGQPTFVQLNGPDTQSSVTARHRGTERMTIYEYSPSKRYHIEKNLTGSPGDPGYVPFGRCPNAVRVGADLGFGIRQFIFFERDERNGSCQLTADQKSVFANTITGNVCNRANLEQCDNLGGNAPPGDDGGGNTPPGDEDPDRGGDDGTNPDSDPGPLRESEVLCDAKPDGNGNGIIDGDGEIACIRREFENAGKVPENLQCNSGTGIKISTSIGGDSCVPVGTSIASNPIIRIIRMILRVVFGGVGLVVAGMIILSGFQYMTSQGNPQKTTEAKQRLTNAIIGLLMYIFAAAILNFLVPGGIIGG